MIESVKGPDTKNIFIYLSDTQFQTGANYRTKRFWDVTLIILYP